MNPGEVPEQPVELIELRITLNPADGSIRVSGPIGNKIVCYGMLETAKEVIKGLGDQQPRGGLVLPQGRLNGLRG